jgi:acetyl esterase/lipase
MFMRRHFVSILFSFALTASLSPAQLPVVVPLWNGPAPQSHGSAPNDIPTLTVYLPQKAAHATSAVVICPGGGYNHLAFDKEGTNEAAYFQQRGVAGLVLKYRLPKNGYLHPVPLLDAQRAIRLVRSHAADWNIDPAKVGIMGFSAGGHLASTAETHYDSGNAQASDPVDKLGCRPDFAALVYPIITMKDNSGSKKSLLGPSPDPAIVAFLSSETQVTPQTPPTVFVFADDDKTAPPVNIRLMYDALQKAGVASALQEYPLGGHGFGFGHQPDHSPPGWLDKVYDWLKVQGFLP